MLIAVDVDDTIADFMSSLIEFHNNSYNTSLTKNQFFTYDFWKIWGGTKEEAIAKVDDYAKTDYFKDIKPLHQAVECINALKQRHNLVVITSRPNGVVKQTKEWIDRYFPNIFSRIYYTYNIYRKDHAKTKEDVCLELGVDIIIEDNLIHSIDCAKKGIKALLLNHPWNQCGELPENVTRANDWNEILRIINLLD
jgi:uncharacterized HAD superfamily protein